MDPHADPRLIADLLRQSSSSGQLPFLTISSNSMAPLLCAADQVGLEMVTAADLRPGDLVVMRGPAALVTHRYWGRAPAGLITRGDRPLSFDPPWPEDCLVGRVVIRRRDAHELSLARGAGRALNDHLFWLARQEAALFAGFRPVSWSGNENGRLLGRALRRNPRNIPSRLVRRTFQSWSSLLVTIITLFAGRRKNMVGKRTTLAIAAVLTVLVALLLTRHRALASVELSNFWAEPEPDRIVLKWETASEIDSFGFNLWRGTDCDDDIAVRVNDQLIPAVGGTTGALYEYADDSGLQPNVTYDYRLQEIATDGTEACFNQPEFQVRASLASGGTIVTPTPVGGGGSGATSTPAPTNAPGPTGTPAPTNTLRPTAGPGTPQPSPEPEEEEEEPAGGTGTGDVSPPAGQEEPAAPVDGTGETQFEAPDPDETQGNEIEQVGDEEVDDAPAEVQQVAEAGSDLEEGTTGDQAQVIGDGVLADERTIEGDVVTTASTSNAGRRTLFTAVALVGGLLFTLGGAAAIWYLVINRQP